MSTFAESEAWRLAVEITKDCYELAESSTNGKDDSIPRSLRQSALYLSGTLASLPAPTGRRPSHKFSAAYDEVRRLESNLVVAVRLGQLQESDILGIRTRLADLANLIRTSSEEAEEMYKATLAKQNPLMDLSDMFGLD